MSQWMTFLYSPWLGNWSSRPVTKPTGIISKAWWPGGMPNLDRTIALLRMRVDTVSYPHACVVRPPKWPYIRRHIGLSRGVRVWPRQSLARVIHNPGPSWDFRLGLCLACSPLQRWIRPCVSHLFVSRKGTRRRRLCLHSNHRDSCRYVTACNRVRQNHPS